MTPLDERQKTLIVNNVVRACKDISKLNGTGYKYLYLCSGFIAHYNISGFKDFYTENSLKDDIRSHCDQNQWSNFNRNCPDYDYYMSKRDIYNRILENIG